MHTKNFEIFFEQESGVGKSSIVMRFVTDSFKPALESTIGASFMSKKIALDDQHFAFQIWDTAGQEKYRSLAPMYYRGAAAAIIVYDVSRDSSFKTVRDWVNELKKNASPQIVLAIAGNKCDLEDLREVNKKDAEEYAKEINAIFIETSALTAVNVPELFMKIARSLPKDDMYSLRSTSTVNLSHQTQSKPRGGCCGGKSSTS